MKNQLFDFDSLDEICLIDDDASYIFLNKVILKITHPHFKPLSFQNLDVAFDHFRNNMNANRLLFLDLHMGMRSGFDFLDQLSTLILPNTQVVMHTTCDDEENIQKAFSYNLVKAYITKPLSIEMIEQISGKDHSTQLPLGQLGFVRFKTYL